MTFGVDIKQKIQEDAKRTIQEFQAKPEVTTTFGEPVIGYADAGNPLFDMYFAREICSHPKSIFRPGNTVIVYFIPFAENIVESNRGGDMPSAQWEAAVNQSMWLSMRLNAVIQEALTSVGRLSSLANIPTDWNQDTCREEWSHKLAAYAAGMGHFGPAGSFVTTRGFGGRFGAVITDGKYAEPFQALSARQLEETYQELLWQCKYKEAENLTVDEKIIKACPAKAISKEGIDRKACQAHCKTIDEYIPSPEACGKCFFFL